mmetsp:Transcript_31775/g.93272  ORF Transcript_31775/g.93272 Transcript_31775/m.93272 type:complete len:303 (+) Transcript_31775:382-1290(+)
MDQPNVSNRWTLGQPVHCRIGQIGTSRRRGESHGIGFPTGRGDAVASGQPPSSATRSGRAASGDGYRPSIGKHPGNPLRLLSEHGALGSRCLSHRSRQQQIGHLGQCQGPVGQPHGGNATTGDQALGGQRCGGGGRTKDRCRGAAGRGSSATGGQEEVSPQKRDGGTDGPEKEDGPDRTEEAAKQVGRQLAAVAVADAPAALVMQGGRVCLHHHRRRWQSNETDVGSAELVFRTGISIGGAIVAAPLLLQIHVKILGRAAVAQVRVVDVHHHPLDVPAVAIVHGHCYSLSPGGRLGGHRGGI